MTVPVDRVNQLTVWIGPDLWPEGEGGGGGREREREREREEEGGRE